MADVKYYWLKLHRDFFKRHDVRIIEELPNGKEYLLFYLKLLVESIDHEGSLRFSDTLPYNEQMLSVVTNTNIDVVRSAMKLFIDLKMMSVYDDQTIYMNEVEKMIGSETKWAEKKRLQRAKEDNVLAMSSKCPTELEKEHRVKSIDIDTTTTTPCACAPALATIFVYFNSLLDGDVAKEAEKFHAYNANRGWDCLPDWKSAADLWIARIEEKRG